jgi:hypothetical protein
MAGEAAIGPCGTRGHGSRPSPTARAAAGPDSACGRGGKLPGSTGKCRAFILRLSGFNSKSPELKPAQPWESKLAAGIRTSTGTDADVSTGPSR